jgi:hypothetical protein
VLPWHCCKVHDDHPIPTDSDGRPAVTTGTVLRLTHSQIGKRLGVSADAARQLARRKGWPRSRPNRIGEPAVVSVAEAELASEQPRVDRQPPMDAPAVRPTVSAGPPSHDGRWSDLSVAVSALREAVGTLREQLEHERTRADRATERADLERSLADALHDRIGGLEAELAAAKAQAQNSLRLADFPRPGQCDGLATSSKPSEPEAPQASASAQLLRQTASVPQGVDKGPGDPLPVRTLPWWTRWRRG